MASSLCQEMSSPPLQTVDLMWRIRRWLEQCENKTDEEEIEWWLLVHPLTDGSDVATRILACRLLAVWCWMVMTPRPLNCLSALTILNIGQFLDEDIKWHGRDIQDWLQAYAHTLQQATEAAKGRCWMPKGRDFTTRVSFNRGFCQHTKHGDPPSKCSKLLGQPASMCPAPKG